MIRRSFRIGLRLGLLAGVAFAIFKVVQARRPTEAAPLPTRADPWPPVVPPQPQPKPQPAPPPAPAAPPAAAAPPAPTAPQPQAAAPAAPVAPSRPPAKKAAPTKKAVKKVAKKATKAPSRGWVEPQGQVCPLSHPIKVKLASKIYHLPGMLNYTRTRPDRCYASEAAAKRDGLTSAKR